MIDRERYAYSIINLKSKVSRKAKEVFGKREGAIWWHNKIIEYYNRIIILEEDYVSCMSYHILIGSTEEGEEFSPVVDYFEISSVKNFCFMVLAELNSFKKKELS